LDLEARSGLQAELLRSDSRLESLIILSGAVHTGVEVRRNGLRDERTCGTTLASAYVLRRLSAAWSQLQMKGRKSEWM